MRDLEGRGVVAPPPGGSPCSPRSDGRRPRSRPSTAVQTPGSPLVNPRGTYDPAPTPRCVPKRKVGRDPLGDLDTVVHSSGETENPQMYISAQMGEIRRGLSAQGLPAQWRHCVGVSGLPPTGPTACEPMMKHPEQEGEECCEVGGSGEGTPGGIREAGQVSRGRCSLIDGGDACTTLYQKPVELHT